STIVVPDVGLLLGVEKVGCRGSPNPFGGGTLRVSGMCMRADGHVSHGRETTYDRFRLRVSRHRETRTLPRNAEGESARSFLDPLDTPQPPGLAGGRIRPVMPRLFPGSPDTNRAQASHYWILDLVSGRCVLQQPPFSARLIDDLADEVRRL